MSIKSLLIPCIESQYTQEYIANVFWCQDIAKVSNITLIPYIKHSEIYSIAYINIAEWGANEAAYNFIHRLKNSTKETRIIHHEDSWWSVQINTHNNGDIQVGPYTTSFDSNYFVNERVNEECCIDDENNCLNEEDDDCPIKGINGEYYTIEEALQRLSDLDVITDSMDDEKPSSKAYREVRDEINQLSNELAIHEALKQKRNVTQRDRDFANPKFEDDEYLRIAEEYWMHPMPMYDIPSYEDKYTSIPSLIVRSNA